MSSIVSFRVGAPSTSIEGTHSRVRRWLAAAPFVAMHIAPLAVIFTGVGWTDVVLCAVLYGVRMFGVTGGYHRYFSHRTFKTSRPVQFLLAFLAESSAQKGVLWWASHHRWHHKHSDQPEDIHSPMQRGFWYSHVGWVMNPDNDDTDMDRVKDLARYPELRWLSRYHLVPPTLLALAVWGIFGASGLVVGFFWSTMLLYHGTFTINSLSHVFGTRHFPTTDDSRNNPWLALITLGEGWHNNHHYYQSSARNGFLWWEIDITYYVLRAMAAVGLVWDLRPVPERVLEARQESLGPLTQS